MKRFLFFTVIAVLYAAPGSMLWAQEPTDFFESKIRPLLVAKCYECHSAETKKHKGGLQVDTKEALLKGGETGPALVAGNPAKSLLMSAVRWADKDLQMPPKEQLSAHEIADLEAWIKMGAPDPRTGTHELTNIEKHLENAKQHWALKPVTKPAPPAADMHPVDAFITQKLQAAKLTLSPPADKRTLIRRAYFDLIGLPPSFEEVTAFAADDSPNAFEKVIDKLLADPRYGERWGRHWLDVARYADSMGAIFNGDDSYPCAYTYRDFVIRSFNEDKPYDRFLMEQIAADQIDSAASGAKGKDNTKLAAMAFLTVGRRKDRTLDDDTLDDCIDVLGRGLMGLTISCARCHDHKLEPITTKDYYGLYAVLKSSKEPGVLPALPQPETPLTREFNEKNQKQRTEYVRILAEMTETAFKREWPRVGSFLLAAHDAKNVSSNKDSGLRSGMLKDRKLNFKIYDQIVESKPDWWEINAAIFSPWQAFEKLPKDAFEKEAPALAAKFAANADRMLEPAIAALFAGAPPIKLEDVAQRYDELYAKIVDRWFADNAAALKQCRELNAVDLDTTVKILHETIVSRITQLMWTGVSKPDDGPGDIFRANEGPWYFPSVSQFYAGQSGLLIDVPGQLLSKVEPEINKLDQGPGAPIRAMAFFDEPKPYAGKVFVRGNPNVKGADAPRKFLTALQAVAPDPFPANKSGRLELAKAIASKSNPLTARVIVNRIWQWHFGEGIVRTPSDFGFRGDAPTHPELLDHLTSWFMENGWSFKKLHKHLMLSATYQQRSAVQKNEFTAVVDPANKLLWSFPVRPLELEPFRDAVLAVSGRLNGELFGKPIKLTDNTPASLRRTVYGYVDRKTLPNLYRSFDFPDPNYSSPKRSRTALTPRALILMNSPLITDSAKELAASLAKALPDDPGRVKELYRRVLQREPIEKEAARALAYLASYPPNDLVQPEAKDWQYGFGAFDLVSKQIKDFASLTSFDGKTWKATAKMPDGKPASIMLDAQGGDPGANDHLSSVRRWVAPQDGHVTISAELSHTNAKTEGIVARLISKRKGLLGEWKAKNNSLMTEIKDLEVKQGDLLDFIVSSASATDPGVYQWAPTIMMPGVSMPGMPGMPKRWDARTDFADPNKPPKPFTAWEELAQALLLSNEFGMME